MRKIHFIVLTPIIGLMLCVLALVWSIPQLSVIALLICGVGLGVIIATPAIEFKDLYTLYIPKEPKEKDEL